MLHKSGAPKAHLSNFGQIENEKKNNNDNDDTE